MNGHVSTEQTDGAAAEKPDEAMATSRVSRRWIAKTMKAIALSTVLSAILFGVLAASAGATTPAPVTFNDNEKVAIEPFGPGFPGAGTSTGTSIASGAVADSFALSEQFMFGDGTIHIQQTLTSANGTIAMSIDARIVGFTATTLTVQGDWAITSGIGSYASLHGHGTYASTVDTTTDTITATLTGFGQYDAGGLRAPPKGGGGWAFGPARRAARLGPCFKEEDRQRQHEQPRVGHLADQALHEPVLATLRRARGLGRCRGVVTVGPKPRQARRSCSSEVRTMFGLRSRGGGATIPADSQPERSPSSVYGAGC